jgi:hypothetical protein
MLGNRIAGLSPATMSVDLAEIAMRPLSARDRSSCRSAPAERSLVCWPQRRLPDLDGRPLAADQEQDLLILGAVPVHLVGKMSHGAALLRGHGSGRI